MREMEWTSPQPVTPTKKENVASALADMVKYGVKIYFIDKATYADIQQASDGGESIVKSLVPYKG
jgi:hypothetical protein